MAPVNYCHCTEMGLLLDSCATHFWVESDHDPDQVQVLLHMLELMVLISWTQQQRSAPVGEMNSQDSSLESFD